MINLKNNLTILLLLLLSVGCAEETLTQRSQVESGTGQTSHNNDESYAVVAAPSPIPSCPKNEDQLQGVIAHLADLLASKFGESGPKFFTVRLIDAIKNDVAKCLQDSSVPGSIKTKLSSVLSAAQEISAPIRSGADRFSVTINDESYLKLSEQEAPLPARFFTKALVKATKGGNHTQIKSLVAAWNVNKTSSTQARTIMFQSTLGSGQTLTRNRLLFYVPDGQRTTYALASYNDAMTSASIMSVVQVVGSKVWFRDTSLNSDGSIETPYKPPFTNDCSVCHVGRGPLTIHPGSVDNGLYPGSSTNLTVVNDSILKVVTGFTDQTPGYLTPKYLTFGVDKNSSEEFHNRAKKEGLADKANCSACHDDSYRPLLRSMSDFPSLLVARDFMPVGNIAGSQGQQLILLLKDDYEDKICRKMGGCLPKPTPTPTFAQTPTKTPVYTATPTRTPTRTPVYTPTPSRTPTRTSIPTIGPGPMGTPTRTPTFFPTPTRTPTSVATPTRTATFNPMPTFVPFTPLPTPTRWMP